MSRDHIVNNRLLAPQTVAEDSSQLDAQFPWLKEAEPTRQAHNGRPRLSESCKERRIAVLAQEMLERNLNDYKNGYFPRREAAKRGWEKRRRNAKLQAETT